MHSFHLFCSASTYRIEIIWTQSTSLEGDSVYTYAYTQSASGADISSDSSWPAGVWRATTRSRNLHVAVVWVLAVDPRCCSKSCQSASAVLHGWERQDSRADFSVFSYAGEGSACQHTSTQWHLKAVDFLFITVSCHFFVLLLLPCVWEQPFFQRRKKNGNWIYKAAAPCDINI